MAYFLKIESINCRLLAVVVTDGTDRKKSSQQVCFQQTKLNFLLQRQSLYLNPLKL